MTEIPESVMEEARKVAGHVYDPYSAMGAHSYITDLVARATLAERERIASRLFNRSAFMVSVSGPIPRVEVRFKVLEEMQDFHSEMVELSRAAIRKGTD